MNSNFNRFSVNPTSLEGVTRSRFKMPFSHKTSFNAGDLIPIKCFECLAGDTFSLDLSSVVRMSTPIFPVMDNAYMDLYAFYMPMRPLWDHYKEFMGENTQGPWAPEIEYTIPQLRIRSNAKGSIYDHLGIPLITSNDDVPNDSFPLVNALPTRMYGMIWNEWFRDQNVSAPLVIDTGDSNRGVFAGYGNLKTWFEPFPDFESGTADITTDWLSLGIPLPVAKFHDFFTSALPEPQKGPSVELPIGDVAGLTAEDPTLYDLGGSIYFGGNVPQFNPGYVVTSTTGESFRLEDAQLTNNELDSSNANNKTNLKVDLSSATSISVNTMRQMFAMQRLFEKDARGGTRYREIIKTHFGVQTGDLQVQVPEFLAGKRVPINMTSVPQTSSSDSTSPQGNVAAFSHTSDSGNFFTYSCKEPGYIMILACVRTDQSYAQGLHKMWSRKRRYDFYWPVFAHLGEQPIYGRELYIANERDDSANFELEDKVFGFQEAWAEYRYQQNTVSGALRPGYEGNLSFWTYAQNFSESPTLSPAFIYETRDNVDRTLAVTSKVEDQFFADFYFDMTVVRPMPLYSVPGLIDHF